MRTGIVLGGGGTVGVAWERGLIEGLAEGGIDLRRAEVFVGSSAGSLIGSLLASGREFLAREPDDLLPPLPMAEGGPDLEAGSAALAAWAEMDRPSAAGCAAVGLWALRARTASETAWIAATGDSLGLSAWPEQDLRISVVDAETGERRLFDRSSGVPLSRAVAASCAVPGLFPPIDIDGRRYMDGGVWSGTHADCLIAEAPERVVVIAPMIEGVVVFGELMERTLDEEIRGLEAAGSRVLRIVPKAEDRRVFGPNMMDSTRSGKVRLFARERGRALAASEDWSALAQALRPNRSETASTVNRFTVANEE